MIKRILKFIAIFFLVVVAIVGAAISLIATPEFLTPRVMEVARQSIKSDFSVARVDLSLFQRFPNLTLRIDSLRITQTKEDIDDLLFARECRIAVDPVALLFKRVVVNHLSLRDAQIYVYVDSLHGPLKCLNLADTTSMATVEAADSLSSFDVGEYELLLRRLRVDSLQFVIDDRTREFYSKVRDFNLDMSLSLSSGVSRMRVKTGFENLLVWHKGEVLVKKTSAQLDSKMLLDQDSMKLSFHQADLHLNGIDFTSSGELRRDSTTQNILVDISSSLSTPSLAEFLELIPSSMIDGKEKITTQGSVALDLRIEGEYSEDLLPTISADIKIDDAKAKYASRKLSLENVSCDGSLFVDFNTPARSYAQIRDLQINTSEIIDLGVSGKVTNILDSPSVDLTIRSDIDFDRFTEVFPLNEGIICSGRNVSDIKTQFAVDDVMNANYAKLYIDGESTFQNMEISFDASKFAQDSIATAYLYMKASEGKMIFGDKILAENDSRTLRSTINFSGLGYKAKSGEYLHIKDIELSVGANFDRTTSAVNGVGVRGVAKNTVLGVDSLFNSSLESSDVTLTISPKNESRDAKVHMQVSSEQITAKEPTFNTEIALSSVYMDLDLLRQGEKVWDMAGSAAFSDFGMYSDIFPLDVTIPQTSVSLDNEIIYLTNASMTLGGSEIVATGQIKNLMHKFFVDQRTEISGELSIKSSILDISELMDASNKSYMLFEELYQSEEETTEEATLLAEGDETSETSEDDNISEILVAEYIEPSSVAESGPAPQGEVAAEILADTTASFAAEAVDQTIAAPVTDSIAMSGADSVVSLKLDTMRMRERREQRAEPITGDLFLVPRRVSFILDLNVEKALFEDGVIENLEGRAIINRGALTLEKLSLRAIGADATGSLVYSNIRGTAGANVAFNMDIEGVDINRIGELAPSINAMFPMLDSFEGIVDFSMKVNTDIQSDTQLDIATLRSAMMFKGRELVLMDSETFAALSKTLMFKNKDRNLIDSIEAYALVEQNKVDVLPFSMSIDRYTAIIGGSQEIDPLTFDIDYKYNVSIMKSPLPFKAGVDIEGDLEDFKFKITTAKLKNTNFNEQLAIYEEYRDSIK